MSVKEILVSLMHHGRHSETESEEEGKIIGKRLKELLDLEQTAQRRGSLAKPNKEKDLQCDVTDRSNQVRSTLPEHT